MRTATIDYWCEISRSVEHKRERKKNKKKKLFHECQSTRKFVRVNFAAEKKWPKKKHKTQNTMEQQFRKRIKFVIPLMLAILLGVVGKRLHFHVSFFFSQNLYTLLSTTRRLWFDEVCAIKLGIVFIKRLKLANWGVGMKVLTQHYWFQRPESILLLFFS